MKPYLHINILGRRYPTYLFLGITGYVLGVSLVSLLIGLTNLDPMSIVVLAITSAATCLGLIWMTKFITGKENIVYYHHEIAIIITSAIAMFLMGQPVLTYLDPVLLGIGTLTCIGRWGCYNVGCCHGLPSNNQIGVVYGEDHAKKGFPRYYVGLKMFPIPIVESISLFLIISGGIFIILNGYTAGTVLVWYTVVYGCIRFCLEYFRGDPGRPYFLFLSEAQWTTLILLAITLILSNLGILPFYGWHYWLSLGLLILAVSTVAYHLLSQKSKNRLLNPRHIREINRNLQLLPTQLSPDLVPLTSTSIGLVISLGQVEDGGQMIHHYTLSSNKGSFRVTGKVASIIADLLILLKKHPDGYQIQKGREGIYHILFSSE